MPNLLRTTKEYLRILRLTHPPISSVMLANCWLRLQFTTRKKQKPFAERIGKLKLFTPSYYDFCELFDEIFLVNNYYTHGINEQSPVIFDCGGNCGFTTIYLKLMYPQARLTVFEPNPEVFNLLKINMEINEFSDITLINAACGAKNEEIDFAINEQYSLASSSYERNSFKIIKVKKVALADYINEEISLIKMDIEGDEFETLTNLIETGKIQKIKRFSIEYHHRLFNPEPILGKFLKMLEDSGFDYNLFAYRKPNEFYSSKWQSMMIYAFKK
ncbi:MAG: FkbM family methyltransferase [Verrucomicrobiia bacterium]